MRLSEIFSPYVLKVSLDQPSMKFWSQIHVPSIILSLSIYLNSLLQLGVLSPNIGCLGLCSWVIDLLNFLLLPLHLRCLTKIYGGNILTNQTNRRYLKLLLSSLYRVLARNVEKSMLAARHSKLLLTVDCCRLSEPFSLLLAISEQNPLLSPPGVVTQNCSMPLLVAVDRNYALIVVIWINTTCYHRSKLRSLAILRSLAVIVICCSKSLLVIRCCSLKVA